MKFLRAGGGGSDTFTERVTFMNLSRVDSVSFMGKGTAMVHFSDGSELYITDMIPARERRLRRFFARRSI